MPGEAPWFTRFKTDLQRGEANRASICFPLKKIWESGRSLEKMDGNWIEYPKYMWWKMDDLFPWKNGWKPDETCWNLRDFVREYDIDPESSQHHRPASFLNWHGPWYSSYLYICIYTYMVVPTIYIKPIHPSQSRIKHIPSGELTLQLKMAIEIVDFPIKNCNFPLLWDSSPEGISLRNHGKNHGKMMEHQQLPSGRKLTNLHHFRPNVPFQVLNVILRILRPQKGQLGQLSQRVSINPNLLQIRWLLMMVIKLLMMIYGY